MGKDTNKNKNLEDTTQVIPVMDTTRQRWQQGDNATNYTVLPLVLYLGVLYLISTRSLCVYYLYTDFHELM